MGQMSNRFIQAMLYTWMITINNFYRDYQCAVSFINEDYEIADDVLKWVFHSLEHLSWTLLSILIPTLIIRIALIDIPSTKKNIIGRFNERFEKWICGYENWRNEVYFYHTTKVATSRHLQKSNASIMSRICFTPRNIFKFHSRLIAIFFCSLFAILLVILMNAIVVGPTITMITGVAVYYWQVYAPVIGAMEMLLNLNNETAGHFDADKIKTYVEVFQEMIFKDLTETPTHREI